MDNCTFLINSSLVTKAVVEEMVGGNSSTVYFVERKFRFLKKVYRIVYEYFVEVCNGYWEVSNVIRIFLLVSGYLI